MCPNDPTLHTDSPEAEITHRWPALGAGKPNEEPWQAIVGLISQLQAHGITGGPKAAEDYARYFVIALRAAGFAIVRDEPPPEDSPEPRDITQLVIDAASKMR